MKITIDGLKDLDRTLGKLPARTGKAVMRRVLRNRAQPIASAASANATKRTGALAGSAAVSTVLSGRQRALHRKMVQDDKASVEMFVGFGTDPAAHMEEFGSENNTPHPMLRPAWDAGKTALLDGIKADMWQEIAKSAARVGQKAAKAGK